jgi:small-conductance mechanosensitive channel
VLSPDSLADLTGTVAPQKSTNKRTQLVTRLLEDWTPDFATYSKLQDLLLHAPKITLSDDSDAGIVQDKLRAAEVGHTIFQAMDVHRRGYLDLEDFYNNLPPHLVRPGLKFFDQSGDGKVFETEMVETVCQIYQQRKSLARSVQDRDNIASVVSKLMKGLLFIIGLVVLLILLQVDWAVFLPFATLFLGLSFIFGSALQNIFESMMMIFFVKPFEQGDRVKLGGETFIVSRIHLLSTQMLTTDGRFFIVPNSTLIKERILNMSRSAAFTIQFELEVAFETPAEAIQQLQAGVKSLCNSDPRLDPEPFMWLSDLRKQTSIVLQFWIPLRKIRWDAPGSYLLIQTDVMAYVRGLARDLGIVYHQPDLRVRLQQTASETPRAAAAAASRGGLY